jgi:formylmethanofuran dehydrogenase subunit E
MKLVICERCGAEVPQTTTFDVDDLIVCAQCHDEMVEE